jgi:hypothetical protein
MRKGHLLFICLALIVLLALTIPRFYIVREAADGILLWNSDKAYAFVTVVSRGVRLSPLGYVLESVNEYFRSVRLPDDKRSRTEVIDISGEQHRTLVKEDIEFSPQVVNDAIVGGSPANGEIKIWKWDGTNFVAATAEERRALEAQQQANNLAGHPPGPDLDDLEHWWRRTNIFASSITPSGSSESPLSSITVIGKKTGSVLTLDLLSPGRAAQRIWTLDIKPHTVSKSQYERIFHGKEN